MPDPKNRRLYWASKSYDRAPKLIVPKTPQNMDDTLELLGLVATWYTSVHLVSAIVGRAEVTGNKLNLVEKAFISAMTGRMTRSHTKRIVASLKRSKAAEVEIVKTPCSACGGKGLITRATYSSGSATSSNTWSRHCSRCGSTGYTVELKLK